MLLSQEVLWLTVSGCGWWCSTTSMGAGVALRIVVFSHLLSCTSPSASDWNCLVQLEEVGESAVHSL